MVTSTLSQQSATTPSRDIAPVHQVSLRDPKDLVASGDLVTIPDVPIFKEHETRTKEGKTVRFGRRELQAVVDACNRRIRQSGDYAGITIGHLPTMTEQGNGYKTPPTIGFAGPFKLGRLGQESPRWVILADFHVFRDVVDQLKYYPRRSAEVWFDKSFTDVYIDPICLLGAEPPRLDLGLLYSARHHSGKELMRYSMPASAATFTAPGAFNTSLPASRKTRKRYQKGSSMPSPEDLKAFIEAFMQTKVGQFLQSLMQEDEDMQRLDDGEGDMPKPETPAEEPSAPVSPIVEPGISHEEPDGDEFPDDSVREDEESEEYRRRRGRHRKVYSKTADQTATPQRFSEVATLEQRIKAMEKQLAEANAAKTDALRYSRLQDLRQVRAFDLDAEYEALRYSKVSDAEFERFCKTVERLSPEIPIGQSLPVGDSSVLRTVSVPGNGDKQRERYSKQASDAAMARCKADTKVDYDTALREERTKLNLPN